MLPKENKRIKDIINHFCDGNELSFSKAISVSQPRINRLFSKDKRSGKYPVVSFEIIQKIINIFVDINPNWLLTGKEPMLKKNQIIIKQDNNPEIIDLLKKVVKLQDENATLKDQISKLKKEQEPDFYGRIVAEPNPELKKEKSKH